MAKDLKQAEDKLDLARGQLMQVRKEKATLYYELLAFAVILFCFYLVK